MTTLCLTGWQQPADALANIAPDAVHFDYDAYASAEAAFSALPKAELAIGWSLGGQVLARAIAGGYITPKRVLLLGAPFQFVADEHFPKGAALQDCEAFRDNYMRDPQGTLSGFGPYIVMGDSHAGRITRVLHKNKALWKNGLYWLDDLYRASCRDLDFSRFPKTVIVQGAQDRVVHPDNAAAFSQRLPQCELQLWKDCAHAPHLHDEEKVKSLAVCL